MDNNSDDDLSENPLATGGSSVAELIRLEEVEPESYHHDEVEIVAEQINIEGEPEIMEIEAVDLNNVVEGSHENINANNIVENDVAPEGSNDNVVVNNFVPEGGNGNVVDHEATHEDDDDVINLDLDLDEEYDPGLVANVALEDLTDNWNKKIEQHCGGKPNYFDKDHQEENYDPLRKKMLLIGGVNVRIATGRDNTVFNMPVKRSFYTAL